MANLQPVRSNEMLSFSRGRSPSRRHLEGRMRWHLAWIFQVSVINEKERDIATGFFTPTRRLKNDVSLPPDMIIDF